tara:strand:- start:1166 stop:1633 length:468 start_codon:yes stop_codon:yes gene_type:complete
MQLSKNLSLAEVTKSATAKRRGISNEPTIEHLENLRAISKDIFQRIRDEFMCPIFISSGYRSIELNKAIGGSLTSQHSKGEALDLDADVYGVITNADIFHFIEDRLPFDQLIWEFGTDENPDWVHVSYKRNGKNRHQILKAVRVDGKTKYETYGK